MSAAPGSASVLSTCQPRTGDEIPSPTLQDASVKTCFNR